MSHRSHGLQVGNPYGMTPSNTPLSYCSPYRRTGTHPGGQVIPQIHISTGVREVIQ